MNPRTIISGAAASSIWCLACLVLLLTFGCEAPPAQQTTPTSTENLESAESSGQPTVYWSPEPTSIRVYPSTRFIQESGRAILEARFELFDQMGDPMKASGTFRIELHSVNETLGSSPRRLLYTWNAETMTLAQQREHYDPITRGYLFRLGVDNLRIAKQTTLLKVAFTPVDKPRLTAEAMIRSDW